MQRVTAATRKVASIVVAFLLATLVAFHFYASPIGTTHARRTPTALSLHVEKELVTINSTKSKRGVGFSKLLSAVHSATIVKTSFKNMSKCVAKTHIFYLKVHKTGSTTLTCILYRFGLRNNLTFATFEVAHPYPANDVTEFILPHTLDIESGNRLGHPRDIMNSHSVFNEKNARKFMPNDTVFIATIRHPLAHLKSTFNHYKLEKHLQMPTTKTKSSVDLFLENPAKYDKLLPASLYNFIAEEQHVYISFTKNRMAFEFGFDLQKASRDAQYIEEYLAYLNDVFSHVIITEYYDESLVMLRKKLCWSYKDIIYLPLRKKTYAGKERAPDEYGQLYKNHKQWASLDYKLYHYFIDIHEKEVTKRGVVLQKEVQYFQQVLEHVSKFCYTVCEASKSVQFRASIISKQFTELERVKRMSQDFPKTKYHGPFELDGEYCFGLMIGEGYFGGNVRRIQYERLNMTHSHPFYLQFPSADLNKEKTLFNIC